MSIHNRIGVGIIGLEPKRSWAAQAHVPALRALPEIFEISGVANSNLESSERAAEEFGIAEAFPNASELAISPKIDLIVVTVKVPHHFTLVKLALEAGKHVFCEWPLGNGLAEAEELTKIAAARGVLGIVGTQAIVAPEVQFVKQLIADGFVGEVLSTTLVGRSHGWGPTTTQNFAYVMDKAQGATMLTVPVGHTLAAVREVLGKLGELSSVLATRRPMAVIAETGELLQVDAPDQVLVSGVLHSGAPISLHYRGGTKRIDQGLLWEINGTEADIRILGPVGHIQNVPLTIEAAQGDEKLFKRLEVPERFLTGFPDNPIPGNVARIYSRLAQDLKEGTRTAPTFDDAVALHRQIEAIERSAQEKHRIQLAG